MDNITTTMQKSLCHQAVTGGILLLSAVLLLYPCVCGAQQAKQQISENDYSKWGTLQFQGIASKGGWVSYRMLYGDGKDTLFITSSGNGRTYNFPKASGVKISPDGSTALLRLEDSQLCWLSLSNGEKKLYDSVLQADFDARGNVIFIRDNAGEKELFIINAANAKEQRYAGVYGYANSPDNVLALAMKSQVLILKGNKIAATIKVVAEQVHGMQWSNNGILTFFNSTGGKETRLYHYDLHKGALYTLTEEQLVFEGIPFRLYMNQLRISADGKSIYTDIMCTQTAAPDTLVEVWRSTSMYEYPAEKMRNDPANMPHLIVWYPNQGRVSRIGNQGRQNVMVLPGEIHALVRTPLPNTERAMDVGRAEYYLTDLSGKKEPYHIMAAGMGDGIVMASRCGKYISFSEGSGVQLFDIRTRQLRDLGRELPGKNGNSDPVLGCAGFTNDSRYMIVFDTYDLWLMPLSGEKPLRMTRGAEEKTIYRVDKMHLTMPKFAGPMGSDLDPGKGIVISAFTTRKTNTYYLYKEGRLETLSAPEAKISSFEWQSENRTYGYLAQRYDTPPYVVYGGRNGEKVLYQSNTHYRNYEWPKFELLDYTNSKGEVLQAILIYPSDYNPAKKYPMVTYIYEKLSDGFHKYLQPTNEQYIGFPPASYFLNGYFVLMPDIAFTENEPGPSALDCVTAAVGATLRHVPVDHRRIGIYGHSFGGYLVNYILTQSTIFSAAVAGAGASDLVNYYLTMNFDRSISNSWKFESGQYRIRSTPMEHMEQYLRNSPMPSVSKVVTPLLSWAGKDDDAVDFRQSVAMHLALRRLGRESTLLLYPGQGHILQSRAAKIDLTTKVREWFDKYLKQEDK